jgi:hypothetical protein
VFCSLRMGETPGGLTALFWVFNRVGLPENYW